MYDAMADMAHIYAGADLVSTHLYGHTNGPVLVHLEEPSLLPPLAC